MSRVSKKDIESQFKLFIEAIGGKVAADYKDVGGFKLDYSSIYGGYRITQIFSEGGAINMPFGDFRTRKGDFYYQLIFATNAVQNKLLTDQPLFAAACR